MYYYYFWVSQYLGTLRYINFFISNKTPAYIAAKNSKEEKTITFFACTRTAVQSSHSLRHDENLLCLFSFFPDVRFPKNLLDGKILIRFMMLVLRKNKEGNSVTRK